MSLSKLSLPVADQGRAEALVEQLCELELTTGSVSAFRDLQVGGWRIDAYCEAHALPVFVDALSRAAPQEARLLCVESLPDMNWVAISQSALPPIAVGRFLIHGSHDRAAAVGRRCFAIEIDASEAFGTAHHASTRGCLVALDLLVRVCTFRRVLDLGCGSGILGIAAAKLQPAARIHASDMDPRATKVARSNARLNRVSTRTEVITASSLSHPALRRSGKFDLVVANILAEPLMALAPQLRTALAMGGHVVLSGLLAREARRVTAAYVSTGFTRVHTLGIEGWTTLVLQRR